MGYSNSRVQLEFQKLHVDISKNCNFFSVKSQIVVVRHMKACLSDETYWLPVCYFSLIHKWMAVPYTEIDMM